MELYHALNRSVEKRIIFMGNGDRARFVHDMYEFNDARPAPDTYRTMWDLRSPTLCRKRVPIVDIHGWCLMGNHYHLLLSERVTGGITLFLRKLNIGYVKYFNEKYKRPGTLFQGRTKKIKVVTDAHFFHILHYIHLNPLDFLRGAEQWRTSGIENVKKAQKHLEGYRWSSYLDYCGKKNFPSIISKDLFSGVFQNYKQVLDAYIRDLELEDIKPALLE